jgi:hypothetical protein
VTLDIGNEAATKGWSKYQTGSVVFQYQQNHSGALGAEVYVENRAQSLSFTIPSVESAPRSATQNAVFWLPSPEGEVYVALQNTSDKAVVLTATATLGGRTISLGDVTLVGHASSVIPLSKRSGFAAGAWVTNAVGGITISAAGNGGVVNTGGWIEDDTTGYSTTLTFADPRVGAGSLTARQILVGAVGQLLDLPAPLIISSQLVVRNVTTQPVVVTGTVVFNDNAGSVIEAPLSQVSLQPGEVRRTDLTTVKKEAGIPDSIVSASIRLQYTGGQGALMARVFGASQDNAYGFYWALQPFAAWSYAEAYWTTENAWTPILTVANVATTADTVIIQITSNKGSVTMPPFHLKSLESRTFNVRDLLAKPGMLPAGATVGGYRITGASDQSRLSVKEHLLDPVAKLATPFYGIYAYVTSYYFYYSEYDVDTIGDTAGASTKANYSDSTTQDVCPSSYSSQNTSDATIAKNGCVGVVTGVSESTTNVFADATLVSDSSGDTADFEAEVEVVVQTPGSVAYVTTLGSQSLNAAACTALGASGQGYRRDVTLQLYDTNSPRQPIKVSGITVVDTLTPGTPNALGLGLGSTGSTTTNVYGQWPDTYFVCSAVCPASTGQSNISQSWKANGRSLPTTNAIIDKCGSITIDGN